MPDELIPDEIVTGRTTVELAPTDVVLSDVELESLAAGAELLTTGAWRWVAGAVWPLLTITGGVRSSVELRSSRGA